jgi:hypothetical protein
MSLSRCVFLGALLVPPAFGCHRLAEEPIDFAALKVDACERACETMDVCDPTRFEGQEPEDCFDRCLTLLPRLHEENQCGSRQIDALRCVGDLTCAGFTEFEEGTMWPHDPSVPTAPCVAEHNSTTTCSTEEPFELVDSGHLDP